MLNEARWLVRNGNRSLFVCGIDYGSHAAIERMTVTEAHRLDLNTNNSKIYEVLQDQDLREDTSQHRISYGARRFYNPIPIFTSSFGPGTLPPEILRASQWNVIAENPLHWPPLPFIEAGKKECFLNEVSHAVADQIFRDLALEPSPNQRHHMVKFVHQTNNHLGICKLLIQKAAKFAVEVALMHRGTLPVDVVTYEHNFYQRAASLLKRCRNGGLMTNTAFDKEIMDLGFWNGGSLGIENQMETGGLKAIRVNKSYIYFNKENTIFVYCKSEIRF